MFGFSKTKKEEKVEASTDVERSIRTMEDDLAGAPMQQNSEHLPPEPPVAFTPQPGQGAPFFSDTPKKEAVEALGGASEASPFLSQTEALSDPVPTVKTPTALPVAEEAVEHPWSSSVSPVQANAIPGKRALSRKKLYLYGSLGFAALVLIGGGVYYLLTPSATPEPAVIPTPQPLAPAPVPPTVPIDLPVLSEPRFSATSANYLSLNTETVTAEGLRMELLKTATEVKDAKLTGAVEFLVRDQNYNPLAFSRFSYLAGINLPEELLGQLEEAFSLFIYIDGERPRMGLSVSVKDPALFQGQLATAEKSLPLALSPLFLDTTTAPKTGLVFRSGSYAGLATRFTNVDGSINLSVDYATRGFQWMIGTSQGSLRAIINKGTVPTLTPPAPTPSTPSVDPSIPPTP